MKLIKKWKKILDYKGYSAAILMSLSKEFDSINRDLLIAKLDAYGVQEKSLKLLKDYISSRYQRTKVNGAYNTLIELLTDVPQGSVVTPRIQRLFP